jgi:hypothetical protein
MRKAACLSGGVSSLPTRPDLSSELPKTLQARRQQITDELDVADTHESRFKIARNLDFSSFSDQPSPLADLEDPFALSLSIKKI